MIVIMTQDKYDEKLAAAQAEGRRMEKREWERKKEDDRDEKRTARNEETERKLEKFRGVGIEILSIEQTSEAWGGEYSDGNYGTDCDGNRVWRSKPTLYFSPPKYWVKFRTRGGVESEVSISFDTPNFTMQDVRSAVHLKLCGGGCA